MDNKKISKRMQSIINRIKNKREELGFSFQDLSDITGISKSTLQRYETGYIKNIPMDKFEILSKALGIHPAELMGWTIKHSNINLSNKEKEHLNKYKQLNDKRQNRIDKFTDIELEEQKEELRSSSQAFLKG